MKVELHGMRAWRYLAWGMKAKRTCSVTCTGMSWNFSEVTRESASLSPPMPYIAVISRSCTLVLSEVTAITSETDCTGPSLTPASLARRSARERA